MSLNEYFESLQVPFADLIEATDNFSDEILLTQGSSFEVYKTKLLSKAQDWGDVVIRKSSKIGIVYNELVILRFLEHQNIASPLIISGEQDEAIIINKYEANGSLEKHLNGPNMTWMRRLHICVRIADALKYLHYDAEDDYHIIHSNLKTSKVLLDHSWEPKLHGFGVAVKAKKHHLHPASKNNGSSLPHMDPNYEKAKGFTHKSDIYSFGVMLFEVLFGREALVQNNDNWYFARLARSHYEEKKLDELIDPDLRRQMTDQSLNMFAETAYYCLEEKPLHRPDTIKVLSRLENALQLQENPTITQGATSSNYLMEKNLDHLKFRLSDIKLATDEFSKIRCIGSGGYGDVYKAQLNLHTMNLSMVTKGMSKGQLHEKLSDVAIKRIFSENVEQGKQGFNAEIEMLSKCKHPNVVTLHGFCDEGEEMILVYEYVSKGSLASCLEKVHNKPNISWARRIQICLDIAHGLKYLHTNAKDKKTIIHCDIKSDNVLLDDNWVAKIADFGLSKLHHANQQRSTAITNHLAGTNLYMDPEYMETGKLKIKSDIYSFGVVMFEIMCGKLAHDVTYGKEGLPSIARQYFKNGTIKKLVDPKVLETDDEHLMLIGPVDQDSLETFTEVAYECLNKSQSKRPTMEYIIKELEKALDLQENPTTNQGATSSNYLMEKKLDHLKFRLSDIKLATHGFSKIRRIGSGGYGDVYKAQLNLDTMNLSMVTEGMSKGQLHEKRSDVAIKRIFSENVKQGKLGFNAEIEMLSKCKHPNIVTLHGFCDEGEEMILVYEYVSKGSLASCLEKIHNTPYISWARRIQICLDIAHGLKYLHTDAEGKKTIIHRDIKSDNVLLDDNWVAKIADFGLSKLHHANQQRSTAITYHLAGTDLYMDPEYMKTGKLKIKSDIYSFGVVMFEIMCGKLAHDITYGKEGLPSIARQYFMNRTIKKLVDPKVLETDDELLMLIGPVDQDSLEAFTEVAYECLNKSQSKRPTMEYIIKELEKALDLQRTSKDNLQIPLKAIRLGTQNFSESNCIGEGRFWKLYDGQVEHANRCTNIVAKRWDTKFGQGYIHLLKEVGFLYSHKHESIIGLVGFCNEENENIIVYEHASNGRLDKHLDDPCLTWTKRLQICINVAEGLEWLHKKGKEGKDPIIHRDIKSGSVLLDGDWNAKISNFEMSCSVLISDSAEHVDDNGHSSFGYVDPQCQFEGSLTHRSDIYSFGVILVEMLSGRLAWAEGCVDHSQSLGPLAKIHYQEKGKLDEMIFEAIKEQIVPQSLATFQEIALKCLNDARHYRPYAKDVTVRLKKALKYQEDLHISLEAIKLGTQDFSDCNCIGDGQFWKLYKGEIEHTDGCIPIIAKRWDKKSSQGHTQFVTELDTLLRYKHENIIGLIGFCKEEKENIIVYEHASNGRLDKHLDNPSLTWMKRLQIGIGIANGLRCLHKGNDNQEEERIHRDIKSSNILLDSDWNAKISNLGVSCKDGTYTKAEHVDGNGSGSLGCVKPQYRVDGNLTQDSDVYSVGVILIELLCGKLAETWEECDTPLLRNLLTLDYIEKENIDEMIFEDIKGQIAPESLSTFVDIAFECVGCFTWTGRLYAYYMGIQLKKALNFQEYYEMWEMKLPKDYQEILKTSKDPERYCFLDWKQLYDKFTNGILLQDDKTIFSLGHKGEGNYEMISARKFSYRRNLKTHRYRSLQESRFKKVTEIFDISNLKLHIKITTRFLSVGVNYGAYLIFKFCDTRTSSSTPMYVNLTYKMGDKNLHSYFATWRDDGWMMIDLCRFMSHTKDTTIEVLLESFSRYYCGNISIYVEGVEFRVIDKMNDENIDNVQQTQKSNSNFEIEPFDSILFRLNKVDGKKHVMLSVMEDLYDSSDVNNFDLKPTSEPRSPEGIELPRQQVFHINFKIQSQMLSQDTNYMCYLIFKLSKECHGLHCPVKVRDLLRRNNKEFEIIYFRSPNPWNLHEKISVPEQREDGWMEVKVWKFNSRQQLKNDRIPVNLKLISYEGTMSGLIVYGLEFRLM